MSDDERMDRARRIRELREGNRRGDDRSTGDEPAETDPEAATTAETESTDEDTVPADTDRTESVTDSEPAGTEEAAETPPTERHETEPESAGSEDTADSAEDASAAEPTEREDDATTAAQAAAAAASAFEGGDGVAMDPDRAATATTEAVDGDGPTGGGADESDPDTAPAGATVADATVEETDTEKTRVLEFQLGEERYCLDIEYVEEIVREETVTRVPNTPEYVNGVVDLRGQITTILDPTVAIGIEADADDRLIVVFDEETFDDHGEIGWLVDEVNQVTPINESDVKESPIQEPYINGVIERDDEFVIWTTPELALDAETDE